MIEHPFRTASARMGATHGLTRTLPKCATERALGMVAYNFTRVMKILGRRTSDRGHARLRSELQTVFCGPAHALWPQMNARSFSMPPR